MYTVRSSKNVYMYNCTNANAALALPSLLTNKLSVSGLGRDKNPLSSHSSGLAHLKWSTQSTKRQRFPLIKSVTTLVVCSLGALRFSSAQYRTYSTGHGVDDSGDDRGNCMATPE